MKIKILSEGAQIPVRADKGSAGYDCYVPKDTLITPGRNLVPLGFALELKPGQEGQIRPRSGFSLKGIEGVIEYPGGENKVDRFDADVILGTIDESYRGEVGVIIYSREVCPFTITKGTRIAQLVISRYCKGKIWEAKELSSTERTGGFGHTGTK